MRGRLKLVSALAVSLLAVPADAETECQPKVYEWALELTRVECEEGDADLQVVASALGTQAVLRGGIDDPGHPRTPKRAVLVGSSDGAGLTVSLEKSAE